MKAARVHTAGKIKIEDVPIPDIGANDVLIKVHRVGICGTDVGIKNGFIRASFPVTLGHEFSGSIARLGHPGLGGFKEGDPVSAGSEWACGICQFCQAGKEQYCNNKKSLGITTDGCMAEFVKIDHRVVYKLPSNVSFDEGQNMLNIACVLRAFKKAPLVLGKTVAVFGPGNAGLIMLQVFKMAGAYQAVMVGTRDFRLQLAKKIGANQIVNINNQNPVETISQWYSGGVDIAVEASGNPTAFQNCFEVIKPGGSIIIFGMFPDKLIPFDPTLLYQKEPFIISSKGSLEAKGEAIQLLEKRRLQILPMITHRFPLEETVQAFKTFENKIADALRIIIEN